MPTNVIRDSHSVVLILNLAVKAGDEVDSRLGRDAFALNLVAHRSDGAATRPNEDHSHLGLPTTNTMCTGKQGNFRTSRNILK